jgi:hypothetical protein
MGGVRRRAGHQPRVGSDDNKTVAHPSPFPVQRFLTLSGHVVLHGEKAQWEVFFMSSTARPRRVK